METESRGDNENDERSLYNMNPRHLAGVPCRGTRWEGSPIQGRDARRLVAARQGNSQFEFHLGRLGIWAKPNFILRSISSSADERILLLVNRCWFCSNKTKTLKLVICLLMQILRKMNLEKVKDWKFIRKRRVIIFMSRKTLEKHTAYCTFASSRESKWAGRLKQY